jgi:hypothetical protein
MTNWIQATEQSPPVGKLLVVGRPMTNGTEDIFVGYIDPAIAVPTWTRVSLLPGCSVQPSSDWAVRTTDFWQPLPEWI